MRITEDQISVFSIGAVFGSLLTRWIWNRDTQVISGLRRIISEVQSRIETLGYYNDLTPAQEKLTMDLTRLVSLEAILDYYQWAQ